MCAACYNQGEPARAVLCSHVLLLLLITSSHPFLRDEYVLVVNVYGTIIRGKKQTRHLSNKDGRSGL